MKEINIKLIKYATGGPYVSISYKLYLEGNKHNVK